jgi:hypothetical protein
MAMNKKYDKTDRERDQSRKLEQGESEQKKTRQGGMPGRTGQQQAGDEPRRQHGGWSTDEARRGGPARDRDSGEKLVDEP